VSFPLSFNVLGWPQLDEAAMTRQTPVQKFYQKGTFTFGNRLSPDAFHAAPAMASPLVKGHEACPGCGIVLAARHVAAVLQLAKFAGTPRILDQSGEDAPKIFERGGDVLCLCYDTEGAGGKPGNLFAAGKGVQFARLHAISYVATATVADLHDLENKLTKAMGLGGVRYLHIHAPCPAVWGTLPRDTIRLARLAAESGFFPIFEAENGVVTGGRRIRHRMPVTDYLRPRLARLGPDDTAKLQDLADRNIIEFDLLPHPDEH
jgi:hypothetical protein